MLIVKSRMNANLSSFCANISQLFDTTASRLQQSLVRVTAKSEIVEQLF